MDQGIGKKKNVMGGGPLRIDHSDVYFQNERLADDLGMVKDILLKYKLRQQMGRDNEIKELRRNIGNLEAIKKSVSHTKFQKRPQTTPAYIGRTRSQSRIMKLNVHLPDEDSDLSDLDSDISSVVMKPLTFQNNKVNTRSGVNRNDVNVHNKLGRKYPSSWYTNVLQPSGSILKNKSPAKPRPALGRSKSAGCKSRGRRKFSIMNEIPDPPEDEPAIVCSKNKPPVLSRRKLIQMTNLDFIAEPEVKIDPVSELREMNRIHNERLQIRIGIFLDSLEEVKERREKARLDRRARRMSIMYSQELDWSTHDPQHSFLEGIYPPPI